MYDLHTHSTASDGAFSPSELVERASAAGITSLALTDHDTTQGLAEARAAASIRGITLVPGVEISASWRGHTVHIVGLHVDDGHSALQQGLLGLQAVREERAIEMGMRLARAGFHDPLGAARSLAGDGMITRTHFARYIVESGRAKSMQAVFRHFLKPGKPGYVPTEWARLEEAIDWIRQAGGAAVLAHPQRYKISGQIRRCLAGEFKEAGGAAIEVIAGTSHPPDVSANAELARRFGLAASVGTDFHSPAHSWLKLGALPPLPADLLPVWEVW
ncbi:MAG: PHP domain-containing protein [Methylotetracoccus sp.]|nr:PHP domain-containing protein [Methylotetracoccus sp.]